MYAQDYDMYFRDQAMAPQAPSATRAPHPIRPVPIRPCLLSGASAAAAIASTSYSNQYDSPYQHGLHGLVPSGASLSAAGAGLTPSESSLSQSYPSNIYPHGLYAPAGAVEIPAGIRAGKPDPTVNFQLLNEDLWRQFAEFGTEMIVSKLGRRMFPAMKVKVSGLDPNVHYIIVMDMIPANDLRYRFNGTSWITATQADPHPIAGYFVHPDSPATGRHWMQNEICFQKVKLINKDPKRYGYITLNSMQIYRPRVHIVASNDLHAIPYAFFNTYMFPHTTFMTVTAYQNPNITQLKIHNNPFAKGFRESGQSRNNKKKPDRPTGASNSVFEVSSSSSKECGPMAIPISRRHGEQSPDERVLSDQGYRTSSLSPEEKSQRAAASHEEEEEIDVGGPSPPLPYLLAPPGHAFDEERESVESRLKNKERRQIKREEQDRNRPPTSRPAYADVYPMPPPVRDTRWESREVSNAGPLSINPVLSSSSLMTTNAMDYPYIYNQHMRSAAAIRDSYAYRHFLPPQSTNHDTSVSASTLHNPYNLSFPPPPGSRHFL